VRHEYRRGKEAAIDDLEAWKQAVSHWNPDEVTRRIETKQTTITVEITRCVRETFHPFVSQNTTIDWSLFQTCVEWTFGFTSNEETGYLGEEFVYKQLLRSGRYADVVWVNKAKGESGRQMVDRHGGRFQIAETRLHYDVVGIAKDESKTFFEVKSTRADFGYGKYPFWISPPQWEFILGTKAPNSSVVAVVFGAKSSQPRSFYFTLDASLA
jgi:hypothetical protein